MAVNVPLQTVFANTRAGTVYQTTSAGGIEAVSANTTRTAHWRGGKPHALFEPSRTNSLTKNVGTNINSTNWTESGLATVTTGAKTVAGISASLIDVGASGASTLAANRISRNATISASTKYCLWGIFETNDCEIFSLRAFCSGGTGDPDAIIDFTFSSQSINENAGVDSSGYIPLASGVYLVWMTFTTGTGTACSVRVGGKTTGTTTGEQFYCAALQLEDGSFPTSLIEADASPVVRAADNATCSVSTFPIDQNGGSIEIIGRVDYKVGGSGFQRIVTIDDGTNNNRITLLIDEGAGTLSVVVLVGGASQSGEALAYTSGDEFHAVMTFAEDNVFISLNGSDSTPDTTASFPTGLLTTWRWAQAVGGTNNGAAVLINRIASHSHEFSTTAANTITG